MTTAQTEFTRAELLADHHTVEPLVIGGVRCHGGFDDRAYVWFSLCVQTEWLGCVTTPTIWTPRPF